MIKEKQMAISILKHAGGKENIRLVTHCMTRLRLDLRDWNKADTEKIKEVPGVMGIHEDETLHIIIGPGQVNKVATELTGLAGGGEMSVNAGDRQAATRLKNDTPIKRLLRKIGNIYIPLIPGVVASGILTGIANFAKNAGVDPETLWMKLLLFIGSGIFTYLGVLVGWNTAKEFRGTPVLGAIAGMLIINPALADLTIFGKALVPGQGGFFGIMLAAWLMVVVEHSIRKVIPSAVDILFTPLLTVLLVGMLTLFLIQPAAGVLSGFVTGMIGSVLEVGGFVAGGLLSGFFLPVILVGLHHGLTPIHMELIHTLGHTPLLPILAMAGAGQVGAALAVYIKTRNERLRTIIRGALPVGFLGIGEPLLYGVTLPLGRPFMTACMGGAVGGAYQALVRTASSGIGVSGLSLMPLIADNKYILYLIGLLMAYAAGFLFTYLFGFTEEMADNID
ncbi:PTS transporter subunit EIIC [Domibacillus tundrae]|uniref:PTS transporter subunit EIIC n=1 Tax=Domibacillus tundrae TaxID=1587527 RepID=UPI000617CEA7|nr:PTS transporter subunit EIIC [Domibacillus tundrae]